jgi:polyhydroxybutyrate depolymerase
LALAALAVLLPAALLARAQTETVHVVSTTTGETEVVSLHYGGRVRSYRLYVPAGLGATRHELLIGLHWLNGTAAGFQAKSALDGGAVRNNAVLAYPQGVGRSWDAGTCCGYATRHHLDDVGFVLAVVADVQRRVRIDPQRIAVTGFSNGGLLSYRLVCERPDVFRLAVTVAGDAVGPRCTPARPVSMLHVHGARDSVIPVAGVKSSPLDAAGFPSALTSAQRIAVADRCGGATTTSDQQVARWTARGCDGNAHVDLITVRELGHRYPSGIAGYRSYGVDMTTLTWSFLRSAWPN